jgi:hypothetical protein
MSGLVSHTGFLVATWIAAIFGGIGIAAAFLSTIVGYQLTEEALVEANTKISEARIEADTKIAVAREEARVAVERAQADAAAANARALEAQAELAKLKSPRSLSPEQQSRLVAKLNTFAGQKYSFNVFPDPEPINLLRLIDGVLRRAGWVRIDSQIGHIGVAGAGTAHDSGIGIGVKRESPEMLVVIARVLSDALTSEELPASLSYIAELKFKDAININVGRKP